MLGCSRCSERILNLQRRSRVGLTPLKHEADRGAGKIYLEQPEPLLHQSPMQPPLTFRFNDGTEVRRLGYGAMRLTGHPGTLDLMRLGTMGKRSCNAHSS